MRINRREFIKQLSCVFFGKCLYLFLIQIHRDIIICCSFTSGVNEIRNFQSANDLPTYFFPILVADLLDYLLPSGFELVRDIPNVGRSSENVVSIIVGVFIERWHMIADVSVTNKSTPARDSLPYARIGWMNLRV